MDALEDCPRDAPTRVSLCRLLAQMIDLRELTHPPLPAYTSHMASSFDRRSLAAQPGDEAWLANRDFAQLTPGEPLVLLDVDGPGVITRLWSANPSGVLRVYVDGAPRPVIEAPMAELLRGNIPPLQAPFAASAAAGSNLYAPISFQAHCTITVTSDAHKLFYQINYRRYARGVTVEPFSLAAFGKLGRVAERVARVLVGDDTHPVGAFGTQQRCTIATQGAPDCTLRAAHTGSVLRELRVLVRQPTAAGLRETVLRIVVDGMQTVRVPLGDFFGSGPGLQALQALPVQVDPAAGSFSARWPMPFRHELRITIEQTGTVPFAADVVLTHEPRVFDDSTLLFHADWRAPEWQASKPSHLWTLTTLQGPGLYVGTVLHVTNTNAAWWGEGDEQIWIDGERFPSFFGTGTEDYFGYGWCSNELFSRAYIGQTLADAHANFGRVSLYRFHVLDAIYFGRSLRFDLEVNHWGAAPTPVEYGAVVYYYAPANTPQPTAAAAPQYRIAALNVPIPSDVPAAPYNCGASN
jgi:hypothetical protein